MRRWVCCAVWFLAAFSSFFLAHCTGGYVAHVSCPTGPWSRFGGFGAYRCLSSWRIPSRAYICFHSSTFDDRDRSFQPGVTNPTHHPKLPFRGTKTSLHLFSVDVYGFRYTRTLPNNCSRNYAFGPFPQTSHYLLSKSMFDVPGSISNTPSLASGFCTETEGVIVSRYP